MKINRAHLPLLVIAALAGCVAAPPPPPPPPPAPPARPAPPPPSPPPPRDWRDAAQTPGTWSYGPIPGGSMARFGAAGAEPLVSLRCDTAARTVTVLRAGAAASPVPATITTSSESRPLSASPLAGAAAPVVAIPFAANDRLLDAMAFSRGRFVVDVNGLPTLYLPAWAEVGRVVEDCR
ncbi:hypothetical protein OLX02_14400 [Novosphingobium sp. KCTC 2891]|uniref:hypothetical protein n=1 Tax=Novosphingobium sp. KCTC 2891 TaxID=2989730 RepID=UPI0022220150|nr:hypothetical protein [Novosphingobium sp. KCTC 2891]MCW1384010.1 hypothetical protein [Novosphingobium sp. KCTC 2891]